MRNQGDIAFLQEFGSRVKAVRKMRGMSLEGLGMECNMDRNSIYRIEHGKVNPTISTINVIAKALEIPLWVLFSDLYTNTQKQSSDIHVGIDVLKSLSKTDKIVPNSSK